MLEYNADTPSLILESGDVQGLWYREKFPTGDKQQSNYIDEALKIGTNYIYNVCKSLVPSSNWLGFITFDDDDESYAQMLSIQKYMN